MIHKGTLFAVAGFLACSVSAVTAAPAPPARPAVACGEAGEGLLLPGSGICVRLGGAVRAEAATRSAASTSPSALTSGTAATSRLGARAARLQARGRVDLDARTETAAGPFRAFLSVKTP